MCYCILSKQSRVSYFLYYVLFIMTHTQRWIINIIANTTVKEMILIFCYLLTKATKSVLRCKESSIWLYQLTYIIKQNVQCFDNSTGVVFRESRWRSVGNSLFEGTTIQFGYIKIVASSRFKFSQWQPGN